MEVGLDLQRRASPLDDAHGAQQPGLGVVEPVALDGERRQRELRVPAAVVGRVETEHVRDGQRPPGEALRVAKLTAVHLDQAVGTQHQGGAPGVTLAGGRGSGRQRGPGLVEAVADEVQVGAHHGQQGGGVRGVGIGLGDGQRGARVLESADRVARAEQVAGPHGVELGADRGVELGLASGEAPQPRLGVARRAGHAERRGAVEDLAGGSLHRVVPEVGEASAGGGRGDRLVRDREVREDALAQQAAGGREVVGGDVVAHRAHEVVTGHEGGAGGAVQLLRASRLLGSQACPQERAEEVVVAVPAAGRIHLHQEEVRGADALQQGGAAGPEHGVAQRRVEQLELGGVDDEPLQLGRLEVEHLAGEEVDDVVVGLRQAAQEPGAVRTRSQRQAGEVHARGPPLHEGVEGLELGRIERDAQRCEHLPGLLQGEAQLRLAELEQPTLHAQPPEREGGRRPAPDGQADPGWERRHEGQHHGGVGHGDVEVVEHDAAADSEGGEVVGELQRHRHRGVVAVEDLHPDEAGRRPGHPHRGGHVLPEGARVGVDRVAREPCHRFLRALHPVGEQRGLPGAGRRHHRDQRLRHVGVEAVEQLGAPDRRVGDARHRELRARRDAPGSGHQCGLRRSGSGWCPSMARRRRIGPPPTTVRSEHDHSTARARGEQAVAATDRPNLTSSAPPPLGLESLRAACRSRGRASKGVRHGLDH